QHLVGRCALYRQVVVASQWTIAMSECPPAIRLLFLSFFQESVKVLLHGVHRTRSSRAKAVGDPPTRQFVIEPDDEFCERPHGPTRFVKSEQNDILQLAFVFL